MLVFHNERLALLAVPKTGTTALEGALAPRASLVLRDPPQLKHAPIYRWQRFFVPMYEKAGIEGIETVAAVRHPVDWLGSWYRYRSRSDIDGHRNSTKDLTFDAFVEEYCRGKPAPFAAVGSQARFATDGDGRIAIDHLFRYEARDAMRAFLSERLGVEISEKMLNVSPVMDLSLSLSPAVEEKLRRKRAAEFAVWEAAQS